MCSSEQAGLVQIWAQRLSFLWLYPAPPFLPQPIKLIIHWSFTQLYTEKFPPSAFLLADAPLNGAMHMRGRGY
jgi:hypothetical protein